jgi:WD40 repeat protein
MWFATLFLLAPALAGLAADKDVYGDPLPEGAKARLGTARLRIPTYLPPVLTNDGKVLLVQTIAGLVKMDPATGAQLGKPGPAFYGNTMVVSADGRRIVQAGLDRATVWDVQTGKALVKVERRLPDLPGPDISVALSADGNTLALGGIGDSTKKEPVTVIVWDVAADKERTKVTVPQNVRASVALSADGKTLATWGVHLDPDSPIPPDAESNPSRLVIFWDATTGKEQSRFRVAGYAPATVAFAPDGALAAVAGTNSTINLVDTKTGASKHLLLGRTRMGRALAFSPDGTTVAAAADDGAVQRWKVADGSRLSTTDPPGGAVEKTGVRAISGEKCIAWGLRGAAATIWEVPSGKLISPEGGHIGAVRSVAVSADSKHVVTSSDDGTTLKWELATGKPAGTVTIRAPNFGFGGYSSAATLSPDLTRALVRDSGTGIGVHDLATGAQQYAIPLPLDGGGYATFTPDGARVILVTSNLKQTLSRVTVWDGASAKRLAALELPGFSGVVATTTPDGRYVVTAGRKAAEKGNGEFVVTTWETATGAKKGEFSEEFGFGQPQVAPAPDNKSAAVLTSKGKLVSFDLMTGKLGKTYETGRRTLVTAPVFSPDGTKLAVAAQGDYGPTPSAPLIVLDWASGATKHTFAVPGGTPGAMTFSRDGKWLVTGSPDTTAIVWDVK